MLPKNYFPCRFTELSRVQLQEGSMSIFKSFWHTLKQYGLCPDAIVVSVRLSKAFFLCNEIDENTQQSMTIFHFTVGIFTELLPIYRQISRYLLIKISLLNPLPNWGLVRRLKADDGRAETRVHNFIIDYRPCPPLL